MKQLTWLLFGGSFSGFIGMAFELFWKIRIFKFSIKRTQQAVLAISTHGMLHPPNNAYYMTDVLSVKVMRERDRESYARLWIKITQSLSYSKPWPLGLNVCLYHDHRLGLLGQYDKNSKLSERVLHPNTKNVKGKDIFRRDRQPRRLLANEEVVCGFLPYIRRKCPSGQRRGRPRSCPGNRLRWWTRQFPCPCVHHVGWTVAPEPKTFFCKVWNENIFFSFNSLIEVTFWCTKISLKLSENFHFHWGDTLVLPFVTRSCRGV